MKSLVSRITCSFFLCAALLQSAIAGTFSPELTRRVQTLATALEKEFGRETAKTPGGEHDEDPQQARAYLSAQLRALISHGSAEELDMFLRQTESIVRSPATRQLAEKVHAELKQEIEKRVSAAVAQVGARLAAASKALSAATKPADLDAALRALATFDQPDSSVYSPRLAAERAKLETARQLVSYWQDYLAARDTNDNKTAIQKLEAASNLKVDLLPRSEILARLAELKKTKANTPAEQLAEIMGRTKTLDAIPPAIGDLLVMEREQWNASGNIGSTITFLRSELEAISSTYQRFKDGYPTTYTIRRPMTQSNDADPVRLTEGLRLELLRVVLPRVLGRGAEAEMQSGETMQAYLDRILALAGDRLDARMILRVRELQNTLRGEQVDLGPLQPLLAAQNQDAAEQYAPAVTSYQTALKNGADLVPARQIGARLEAIKIAHPAEHTAGMEQFLKNPPSYASRGGSGSSTIAIPGAITR